MNIKCSTCRSVIEVETDSAEALRAFGWRKWPSHRSIIRRKKDPTASLEYSYQCVSCWIEAISETARTGMEV
jgi:hypothetical protein